MSIQSSFLKSHSGIVCPECFKDEPHKKLKQFVDGRGLSNHLYKAHGLESDEIFKIKYWLRKFQKDFRHDSFIKFCFDKGYLY